MTSYAKFRDAVLGRGGFSVFEVIESERDAEMFDKLCGDPTVFTIPRTFPWIAAIAQRPAVKVEDD